MVAGIEREVPSTRHRQQIDDLVASGYVIRPIMAQPERTAVDKQSASAIFNTSIILFKRTVIAKRSA